MSLKEQISGNATALGRAACLWRVKSQCQNVAEKTMTVSAAQSCNRDVLLLIFSLLEIQHLVATTRTCQSWSPVAYDALYRTLDICWCYNHHDTLSRLSLLSRTLSSSASIRRRIRHLYLTSVEYLPCELALPSLDWLLLLPPSVLSLKVALAPRDRDAFFPLMLRCDFLTGLRSYTQYGPASYLESGDRFNTLLRRMPNLQQTQLSLNGTTNLFRPPSIVSIDIERLVICTGNCGDILAAVIRLVAPRLRIFDCRLVADHDGRDYTTALEEERFFRSVLVPMPYLEQLGIYFSDILETPIVPEDFDFSSYFPQVKRLYFNAQMDFGVMLQHLPPHLEVLGLSSTDFEFHEDLVTAFLERSSETHPHLSKLCLYLLYPSPEMIAVCKNRGIVLHLRGGGTTGFY